MIKDYIYALKKVYKAGRGQCIKFCVINLLLYVIQPFNLICYKKLVESIGGGGGCSSVFMLGLIVGNGVLSVIISNAIQMLKKRIQNEISLALYSTLFDYVSKVEINYLDNEQLYIKLKRAQEAVKNSFSAVFFSTSEVLGRTIAFILIVKMIINESIVFFFIFLLMGILQNVFINSSMQDTIKVMKETEARKRNIEYYNEILWKKECVKEIRFFNLAEWIENKRRKVFREIENINKKFSAKWTKINIGWSLFMYILEGIFYGLLVGALIANKIEIGGVVFLIQCHGTFISSLGSLLNIYPEIKTNFYYIDAFISIEKDSAIINCNARTQISNLGDLKYEIEFVNVKFAYKEREVLKGINLKISKGEKVAIVGENGSGKSTLIKLMMGLVYPKEGKIYRRTKKYSAVFQDHAKFYTSIRENVGFGNLKKLYEDNFILYTLEKGAGDNFIKRYGYDLELKVGKEYFESGIELSGGAWQRMALCRCIACDADIIFLDEFVSALDPVAEENAYKLLDSLFEEKTVVAVTHRIGILSKMDRVVYLENGKILETGTHEELMEHNEKYYCYINNRIKETN